MTVGKGAKGLGVMLRGELRKRESAARLGGDGSGEGSVDVVELGVRPVGHGAEEVGRRKSGGLRKGVEGRGKSASVRVY